MFQHFCGILFLAFLSARSFFTDTLFYWPLEFGPNIRSDSEMKLLDFVSQRSQVWWPDKTQWYCWYSILRTLQWTPLNTQLWITDSRFIRMMNRKLNRNTSRPIATSYLPEHHLHTDECKDNSITLHSPMLMVTYSLWCIESCCKDTMDSGTCSQLSHVMLLSLRAHQAPDPFLSRLCVAPSFCSPLHLYLLSLFSCCVISALVLSLASPPATAAASRASCHSSEGQWSGQLSPGTHHLHTVPSQPPPSHII